MCEYWGNACATRAQRWILDHTFWIGYCRARNWDTPAKIKHWGWKKVKKWQACAAQRPVDCVKFHVCNGAPFQVGILSSRRLWLKTLTFCVHWPVKTMTQKLARNEKKGQKEFHSSTCPSIRHSEWCTPEWNEYYKNYHSLYILYFQLHWCFVLQI